MPKYLVTVSYTADGATGLRKDGGTKRRQAVSHALESLGGKLESMYFCLGDSDCIVIADLPDAISAAGLSIAVSSTGTARLSTTLLLTAEELDHATSKKTAYTAPGA
jgi:uncharacterized protein with GYD domain